MSQKSKFRDEILNLFVNRPRETTTPSPSCDDDVDMSPRREDEVRLTPRHRKQPPPPVLTSLSWRPPYFIIVASLLEGAVFLCSTPHLELTLVYDPQRRHQLWRFLSYMLLHADFLHFFLNVVIQCLLAVPLESEQGHWRTAAVYLGGGLAGALGTSVLQPELLVVGASAGVYALLIAQLANIFLNLGVLRYTIYRVIAVVVLALSDVVFSLHHFSQGNVRPRIGWTAHSTGALTGLLLGLALFTASGEPPRHLGRKVVASVAVAVLGLGVAVAVVFNILHSALLPH